MQIRPNSKTSNKYDRFDLVFVDFSSLASGTDVEVIRYFPFLHLLLLQMCCVTNEIESITLIT